MNLQLLKDKITILFFLIIFAPIQLQGQLEYEFVDSLFQLILLEKMEVYDENKKQLLFEDEPWMELITIDTSVCCRWTRPRFENNIFQKGVDGIIVKYQNFIDTIVYLPDRSYIQFNKSIEDDNGNFKFWKTVFLIKRNDLKKLEIQDLKFSYPKNLITSQNEYWANDLILINEKNYQLDSCHFLYQLKLHENFTFSQSYNEELECFTKKMERDVEIGSDVDFDPKYFDLLQGHFIDIDEGIWMLKNDYLYLISNNGSNFLKFKFHLKSKDELILESSNSEVIISLKKRLE